MDETLRSRACCFTGHRPEKLPWGYDERDPACMELCEKLSDILGAVYRSGYNHFYCGMAQGADLIFCEQVLKLRAEHPDVTIEAVVPCADQSSKWSLKQKERHLRLCSECNSVKVLHSAYTQNCMMERNEYMVERSSLLIAVYDGVTAGGTMKTILLARRAQMPVIKVEP